MINNKTMPENREEAVKALFDVAENSYPAKRWSDYLNDKLGAGISNPNIPVSTLFCNWAAREKMAGNVDFAYELICVSLTYGTWEESWKRSSSLVPHLLIFRYDDEIIKLGFFISQEAAETAAIELASDIVATVKTIEDVRELECDSENPAFWPFAVDIIPMPEINQLVTL